MTAIDPDSPAAEAIALVDDLAPTLIDVSRAIHADPELGFAEHHAASRLTEALAAGGLAVESGVAGLETAFVARAGTTGPTVAILCEYDALPGIGHACGHNVIAAAGLGAGLSVAALAERLGGRVVVVGAPAEEGGGGKVALLDAGVFDGVDAAVMIHPGGSEQTRMPSLARAHLIASYTGRPAHASAAPHRGRNALDAAVAGYNAVSALRQHIRDDERIHGIFTRAGDIANIVPEHTEAEWYVRSSTVASLEELVTRVRACLEAGASAAGCEIEIREGGPMYAEIIDNEVLLDCYLTHARALGREPVEPGGAVVVGGSTDMGNVSQVVPSIHPVVKIAPDDVAIHTHEFVAHAGADSGDRGVIDGAKALAATVVDLWTVDGLLDDVRAEFAAR
ncbi:MAG: M20 family metallopeptidase [Acidimicrobiales bacterium]